ncbi:MAG: UDP-2,4-diacetamido-2,4,6-trideoxy-beta-L-altropyranose hydrolase [Pseudomonadota bacterium]
MKIAIRAEASATIGTGHIRRMLSLAKALRERGAEVAFVTRQLGVDAKAMIEDEGFAARLLARPKQVATPDPAIPHSSWSEVTQAQDIADTSTALDDFEPDRVIVDHYAFDTRWHDGVSEALGVPVMVIDDLADRSLGGRWVLDHNYHPDHSAKFAGRLAEGTELLAGPQYAMIDPTYAAAPRYEFNETVRSIGVFMGGIDLGGDTMKVLDAIEAAGWTGPVEAVVTSHNPARDAIAHRLADWPGGVLSQNLPSLAEFFARHDLQIGAGGGAIWERCCVGPPTIGLVCADNQAKSIPHADKAGFLVGIDHMDDPPRRRDALVAAIRDLVASPDRRRSLSETAMQLVDGRGASRIAQSLLSEE